MFSFCVYLLVLGVLIPGEAKKGKENVGTMAKSLLQVVGISSPTLI